MNNTLDLAKNGEKLTLPDLGEAVNGKFKLVGARRYVAAKAGIDAADIVGKTTKEVVTLAIANGATAEDVSAWRKEFDSLAAKQRQTCRSGIALLMSNPAWKQTAGFAFNAKGEFIGGQVVLRRERSLSVSAVARLEQANAEVAKLRAQIAQLTALPA
jgi:hypothetical protein